MRLSWPPWKRRKKDDVRNEQPPPVSLDDMSRQARFAQSAQERATWDLHLTRARGEEVNRVTGALDDRLRRNHWAEMMQQSFQRNEDG